VTERYFRFSSAISGIPVFQLHNLLGQGEVGAMSKRDKHCEVEGVAVAEELASYSEREKAGPASYSAGHPLDVIQYLEVKLILRPDRFNSVESFRDFGKLVKRTAKSMKVGFIDDPEAGRRPEIREIVFGEASLLHGRDNDDTFGLVQYTPLDELRSSVITLPDSFTRSCSFASSPAAARTGTINTGW
jgi:hypothetical protein